MTKKLFKYIIIIFILLILCYSIYIKFFSKKLIVQPFGIGMLLVGSGSMEPEIGTGDIIIIKKCKEYKIGDIVTYDIEQKYLVTHRIIEQDGEEITTKGDNNNIQDEEKINKGKIYGKVIFKIKL